MWKRNTCTQQTNAFICGLENRVQYVRVQLKLSPRFSFLSVSPLLKESFSFCSFPAFVAFERIPSSIFLCSSLFQPSLSAPSPHRLLSFFSSFGFFIFFFFGFLSSSLCFSVGYSWFSTVMT